MLAFLTGVLWISAMALIIFTIFFVYRQSLILRYLVSKINKIENLLKQMREQPKETRITHVSIQKDEPLSKYETVTLPDDAKIDFVEK